MRVQTGILTETNKKEIHRTKFERRFRSSLEVFNITNGIRPGELSIIVAPSGNGKSTICKTIAVECITSRKKCFMLLSEESVDVYKGPCAEVINKSITDAELRDEILNSIFYETMLEWEENEQRLDYFLQRLENIIHEFMPEMIILDNFSTSFLSELPISTQGKVIRELRKIALSYDIAIVSIFHTAKGTDITKKLITGEDVRGNATSTNAGSYNYIITKYTLPDGSVKSFMFIDKARYHAMANKTYWEMHYDYELEIFTRSIKSSYDKIKDLLNSYNKPKAKRKNEW